MTGGPEHAGAQLCCANRAEVRFNGDVRGLRMRANLVHARRVYDIEADAR
ncbi:unannotated protein [freshwater metagenome]|uniref:Unannotated protein n=1 Tax=freshwater metagenome TaxID=449393 RepID=A0A6J7RLY0_9ZZZZ